MNTATKSEFNTPIVIEIGEYRIRFHATDHVQAGKVYGYQLERKYSQGWYLMDDDGEEMDAIPDYIRDDFRTIVESFGRVW